MCMHASGCACVSVCVCVCVRACVCDEMNISLYLCKHSDIRIRSLFVAAGG